VEVGDVVVFAVVSFLALLADFTLAAEAEVVGLQVHRLATDVDLARWAPAEVPRTPPAVRERLTAAVLVAFFGVASDLAVLDAARALAVLAGWMLRGDLERTRMLHSVDVRPTVLLVLVASAARLLTGVDLAALDLAGDFTAAFFSTGDAPVLDEDRFVATADLERPAGERLRAAVDARFGVTLRAWPFEETEAGRFAAADLARTAEERLLAVEDARFTVTLLALLFDEVEEGRFAAAAETRFTVVALRALLFEDADDLAGVLRGGAMIPDAIETMNDDCQFTQTQHACDFYENKINRVITELFNLLNNE